MNKTHLTLSSADTPFPDELPVIVVVEISGTEFGIELSSVSSITMPVSPVRYDHLPQGVEGMAYLRGEMFPVLAVSEMCVPVGKKETAAVNLVFDARYATRTYSADKSRMLIISASGTQAALVVDRIRAIMPDVSSEQDGRLARPDSVVRLLAAGCIDRFAVVGPIAGGEYRGVALVDVAAFMEACCPVGGLDDLRRAEVACRGLLASGTALGNWRAKRHRQSSDRRAA